jgi:exopolysaccharide biosynthesis polyprenyl glycosylphosphotransferase
MSSASAKSRALEIAPAVAPAVAPSQRPRRGRRMRRYTGRDLILRRVLAVGDVTAIVLALLIVLASPAHRPAYLAWWLLTVPGWLVIFGGYGLYQRHAKRIGHAAADDLQWIFQSMLLGCVLLWGYTRVAPIGDLHFAQILKFAGVATIALFAIRAAVRLATQRLLGPERLLLVGGGPTVKLLVRKLQTGHADGVELAGLVATGARATTLPGLPVISDLDSLDLAQTVRDQRVDRLVISPRDLEETALLDLMRAASELHVKLSLVPRVLDVLGPSLEIDDVDGVAVWAVCPLVLSRTARVAKRAVDVVGATAMLLVAAPLLALITVGIKIESPGPVLFRQRRVGRGGGTFMMLKFRTMVEGAEGMTTALLSRSRDPHWLLLEHDPRVTRLGRLLRLSSLDELPQLWNVLKGQMSLVGPRPLVEIEDREVAGWARRRLDVTPGITGLWQVMGRTNIPFEEMVKLDCLYVTNWSLYEDLRILVRTIPVLFARKGAN